MNAFVKYIKKLFEIFTGVVSRETIVIIGMILGVLLTFHGIIETPLNSLTDLWKCNAWIERKEPLYLDIFIGVLFIVLVIIFILYDKSSNSNTLKNRLPDIAGSYWHYHVTGSDTRPSHNGKCRIMVDKNGVASFHGTRCYGVEKQNGNMFAVAMNIPWESTWTDYGADGWFRCEYVSSLLHGYFKIHFNDYKTARDKFDGVFYMLPDANIKSENPPNTVYGTIVYLRVSEEQYDQIMPPNKLPVFNS